MSNGSPTTEILAALTAEAQIHFPFMHLMETSIIQQNFETFPKFKSIEPDAKRLENDMIYLISFHLGTENITRKFQPYTPEFISDLFQKYDVDFAPPINSKTIPLKKLTELFPEITAKILYLGKGRIIGKLGSLPRCLAFPAGLMIIPFGWTDIIQKWKEWYISFCKCTKPPTVSDICNTAFEMLHSNTIFPQEKRLYLMKKLKIFDKSTNLMLLQKPLANKELTESADQPKNVEVKTSSKIVKNVTISDAAQLSDSKKVEDSKENLHIVDEKLQENTSLSNDKGDNESEINVVTNECDTKIMEEETALESAEVSGQSKVNEQELDTPKDNVCTESSVENESQNITISEATHLNDSEQVEGTKAECKEDLQIIDKKLQETPSLSDNKGDTESEINVATNECDTKIIEEKSALESTEVSGKSKCNEQEVDTLKDNVYTQESAESSVENESHNVTISEAINVTDSEQENIKADCKEDLQTVDEKLQANTSLTNNKGDNECKDVIINEYDTKIVEEETALESTEVSEQSKVKGQEFDIPEDNVCAQDSTKNSGESQFQIPSEATLESIAPVSDHDVQLAEPLGQKQVCSLSEAEHIVPEHVNKTVEHMIQNLEASLECKVTDQIESEIDVITTEHDTKLEKQALSKSTQVSGQSQLSEHEFNTAQDNVSTQESIESSGENESHILNEAPVNDVQPAESLGQNQMSGISKDVDIVPKCINKDVQCTIQNREASPDHKGIDNIELSGTAQELAIKAESAVFEQPKYVIDTPTAKPAQESGISNGIKEQVAASAVPEPQGVVSEKTKCLKNDIVEEPDIIVSVENKEVTAEDLIPEPQNVIPEITFTEMKDTNLSRPMSENALSVIKPVDPESVTKDSVETCVNLQPDVQKIVSGPKSHVQDTDSEKLVKIESNAQINAKSTDTDAHTKLSTEPDLRTISLDAAIEDSMEDKLSNVSTSDIKQSEANKDDGKSIVSDNASKDSLENKIHIQPALKNNVSDCTKNSLPNEVNAQICVESIVTESSSNGSSSQNLLASTIKEVQTEIAVEKGGASQSNDVSLSDDKAESQNEQADSLLATEQKAEPTDDLLNVIRQIQNGTFSSQHVLFPMLMFYKVVKELKEKHMKNVHENVVPDVIEKESKITDSANESGSTSNKTLEPKGHSSIVLTEDLQMLPKETSLSNPLNALPESIKHSDNNSKIHERDSGNSCDAQMPKSCEPNPKNVICSQCIGHRKKSIDKCVQVSITDSLNMLKASSEDNIESSNRHESMDVDKTSSDENLVNQQQTNTQNNQDTQSSQDNVKSLICCGGEDTAIKDASNSSDESSECYFSSGEDSKPDQGRQVVHPVLPIRYSPPQNSRRKDKKSKK